jgi:hypothetical protein
MDHETARFPTPQSRQCAYHTPLLRSSNRAIGMAHMGRAEGYKEEVSSDGDPDIVRSVGKGPADTDQYIESKSS